MFDYFYGQSGEMFSYFRVPKILFRDIKFKDLSTDAKTLYSILLDRMGLSVKNGWLDEQGRVYIIFPVQEVMDALGCADNKATKLFRELEKFGLIERKRRGLGKPNLIYVKNFADPRFRNREKNGSGAADSAQQETAKSRGNKTEWNKTEGSEPDPFSSDAEDESDERTRLEAYFMQSLEVDLLLRLCPDEEDTIDQIVNLLVDTCSSKRRMLRVAGDDKPAEVVRSRFMKLNADHKIRSEFITNRQNHFEEGTLTHRQAKYGYSLSEDRRNLVLNPESAQVVKLIFQMYLEDMKIPEIARALDAQGVPSPQIQMAKKKRSRTKIKWPDSTIRSILKNPLYIGKCTLTLAKAKRELEVPAIVSETEFQKAQKKLESTRLPSRKKARKKPNLLFKKIYDKESGKGLLCRTSEDESQQIYSFDKGYRCFSGKAPFIESEKIFREILSALEKEKMQAAHIDRVLDLNPEKVKQCMDAGLLQYRKKANEIVARLMVKDDERAAVYREYEQGSISLEQVEEYEHQYQVAVQKQEAAFKKVMLAVNDIEKAFSHGNPWLMKFRAISIPNKLERVHIKKWVDSVWVKEFEQVEVILKESQWKQFFPEEWLNSREEDCNGKKE